MKPKKILIVSPSFKLVGGVANHYLGLKDYWSEDVSYEFYGRRQKIPAYFTIIFDLIKFLYKIVFKRPDLIILNPSLRKYQLRRDGIYLKIARFFKIKVITFFHGWDEDWGEELILSKPKLIMRFDHSIFIYVLASKFRNQLEEMGFKTKILLTTTKVNNSHLNDFDLKCRNGKIKTILFLGRIVKNKGIYVAIEAFQILQHKYPYLRLKIVGSGNEFGNIKSIIKNKQIENIELTGPLFGMEIAKQYSDSDIYILPTSGEGMPTSILEAMAFGLPFITTPVGGVVDFFNEKMGILIPNVDATSYAIAIEKFITDESLTYKTSIYNYNYAKSRFMSDMVVKQIESDIKKEIGY